MILGSCIVLLLAQLAANFAKSKVQATPSTAASCDWCPQVADPKVKALTITFNSTVLPAKETSYLCQEFTVPSDRDYHIIAWEPLIANYEFVHHFILYVCDSIADEAALESMGGYPKPSDCLMTPPCSSMAIVWGFGQENKCYDPVVGVPMGKSYYSTVILQIHYNNPSNKSDVVDSSGLVLYYTSQKRPNDNAMLVAGQEALSIPPKTALTSINGTSFTSKNCSQQCFKLHDTYNITSVFFHMHRMGIYGRLSLIKASTGEVIELINQTLSYDKPVVKLWSSPNNPVIEPGDNFEIECKYDSSARSEWTFFGPNTGDEMCYAFIDVYPKPLERMFQTISNIGKIDSCMELQPVIGSCQLFEFYETLSDIVNSSKVEFMQQCSCPIFPATRCTKNCYDFLRKWNILNNICLIEQDGMVFHMATRFWVVPTPEDSMNLLSQVYLCAGLVIPPSADTTCSPDVIHAISQAVSANTTSLPLTTTVAPTKKNNASSKLQYEQLRHNITLVVLLVFFRVIFFK